MSRKNTDEAMYKKKLVALVDILNIYSREFTYYVYEDDMDRRHMGGSGADPAKDKHSLLKKLNLKDWLADSESIREFTLIYNRIRRDELL